MDERRVGTDAVTTQLRLYKVQAGRLGEFVAAWRAGVVPLRRAHGFDVESAWTIPGEDRFVWIVRYEGPLPWEEAERRYYDSPARAALDPDPARLIVEALTWFIEPIGT